MKQICVISGKGGTGKTVLAASFIALAQGNVVAADCDVDAADLHLLLHPKVKETHEYSGGKKAVVDSRKCTQCGRCVTECRFSAIENFKVVATTCEGCGVCQIVCEEGAVDLRDTVSGNWFVSDTTCGPMVHAKLGVGAGNSGKLVTQVRGKAKEIAEKRQLEFVIVDGPPGIGCPVLASLTGIDLALIVTEPTLSGIHDMERVHSVCKHFGMDPAVCVNKFDINIENTEQIEKWCLQNRVPLVGRIGFSHAVPESIVAGKPLVEYGDSPAKAEIEKIWEKVQAICSRRPAAAERR
jgi:MinD superfamily P-loop ATPase